MTRYDLQYYEGKLREGKDTKNNLDKWVARINGLIYVANNEGKPWTSEMLGYPTAPMETKGQTGYDQVGDYHFYLPDYQAFCGVCCERKSIPDLEATLSTGRTRFSKEIVRFHHDDRFERFIVIIEGTEEDYLCHQPEFVGGRFNKRAAAMNRKCVHTKAAAKHGALMALMADGAVPHFAGSRAQAPKDFIQICKIWIRHNHKIILGME